MTEPTLPLVPPAEPEPGPGPPLSIKILGVLALLIGTLGTLGCGLQTLGAGWATYAAGGLRTGSGAVVPFGPGLLAYSIAAAAVDLVTSAALAATAVMALRLSPAGRRWTVVVAAVVLGWAVLKLAAGLGPFRQPLTDVRLAELATFSAEQRKNVPADQEDRIRRMGYVAPLILFALQAIVPALILLFWTRAGVRAAYARPGAPQG